MEKIAIISDIHGNFPALEAVLKEVKNRDINRIFCLGDLIGKGPSPDNVINICKENCEKIVKGNHEELICSEIAFGGEIYEKIKEWHKNRIGIDRINFLNSLNYTIDIKMSGKDIRLFHASHINVLNRIHKNDNIDKHLSMFENTDFTGYLQNPKIVGYGDIHVSYIELIGDKLLFNVGSVGNSLGIDTRASFGIITGEYNSNIDDKLEIEIVKIEYDKSKSINDAKNCDLPEIELYINEIITGKYRNHG